MVARTRRFPCGLMLLCASNAQASQFWRHPFRPVMGSRQLVDFVVLDVEAVGRATDRMVPGRCPGVLGNLWVLRCL